jgi:hypothetical protein
MRIDPKTGNDVHFEYYAIGPEDSPLGFEMAKLFSGWFKKAGLGHTLVSGTWLGMVIKLVNPVLDDYDFMTGVGIVWGSTAPDILRDFTHSTNLPLWNCWYMNMKQDPDHQYCTPHYDGELNQDADYWGDKMMATLDVDIVKHSCFEIQEVLRDWEPYRPLLLWNNFACITGSQGWDGHGGIRIVNMAGQGLGQGWNRQRMYAGRTASPDEILKMSYGSELCSQNPLEADCAVDWGTIMGNLYPGMWAYTPYGRNYWYRAAVYAHDSEIWIGPGSSKRESGNGVYDAVVTYDGDGNMLTYDGKAIADVTEDDLKGDDQLGMKTRWELRDDLYWHDSDPGPDGKFGTADDGAGPDDTVGTADDLLHKVTTADVLFCAQMMLGKVYPAYENVRYYGIWEHMAGYIDPHDGPFCVDIVNATVFDIYEERRFVFSFEVHDIFLYCAKHIWEPYVKGPDDTLGTGDDQNPNEWEGWDRTKATVNTALLDPVRQRLGLSDMYLTDQIGYGQFVYHHGGWIKGVSTSIEYNPLHYHGNPAHLADVDLEVYYNENLPKGYQYYGYVDAADYKWIIDARDHGSWEGDIPVDSMRDPSADLVVPAQIVTGAEIAAWYSDIGESWGAGYPD